MVIGLTRWDAECADWWQDDGVEACRKGLEIVIWVTLRAPQAYSAFLSEATVGIVLRVPGRRGLRARQLETHRAVLPS